MSRAAKRSHEEGELSVETGVAGEGESRKRRRRSAVESTKRARGVSLLSPNFAKFETVRGRPWRLALPRRDLHPSPATRLSPSLSLFLPLRSSARLPLSISLPLRLSLFLAARRPYRRFSIPSRPPSRYYGNFEPIRKSIAAAAGKSAETARVATRRASSRPAAPGLPGPVSFSTSEKSSRRYSLFYSRKLSRDSVEVALGLS